MTDRVIPVEAVEAAVEAYLKEYNYNAEEIVQLVLEAAAPHIIADHLLTLAADVKARGDIGKHGGLEAWDYLTWKAEQLRPAK